MAMEKRITIMICFVLFIDPLTQELTEAIVDKYYIKFKSFFYAYWFFQQQDVSCIRIQAFWGKNR